MDEYTKLDAMGLAALVRSKEISANELLDEALTRAHAAQDTLNCFTTLFPEIGRKQIEDGLPDSPLSGVPFATKDLAIEVQGAPLTNGSRLFDGNIAQRDSVIVERYRKAGLVLFGQTTSPEYGLTTSTESALYGQTRNPWDLGRTSGGSSGGASAAVASGVLPMAQASDGGGSIRIPAACTGLFGMKPSRGRIPMGPDRTENWNGLSTVHAVSRSVRDNAVLMDLTMGRETGSRYEAPPPQSSMWSASQMGLPALKVGYWAVAPNGTQPDSDASAGLAETMTLLESLGHIVEESDPQIDGGAIGKAMLMVISANIAAMVDDRVAALGRELQDDDLEPVTHSMAALGRTVPMAEMARADLAFQRAAIRFETWMDEGGYDVCLMPTLSRAPAPLGELSLSPADPDAYAENVASFAPHCAVFNHMGCPAMSVPLYWTKDGLPLGMMFGARYGQEYLLYQLARQLEQAKPWFHKTPQVFFGG